MEIGDYKFNIGDEVITADGTRGEIINICECDNCKERGFYEPVYRDEEDGEIWISDFEAKRGFNHFYKIGNYTFGNLHRKPVENKITYLEERLVQLRKQLALVEELEKECGNHD